MNIHDDPVKPFERLLAAWNEIDGAERSRAIELLVDHEFCYDDPHSGAIETREKFVDFLALFHERLGEFELISGGPVLSHGRFFLARFELHRGGQLFARGYYHGELTAEGTLSRMVGYLDSP